MPEPFDPTAWIERHLQPERCDTTGFIYDHVESQSGRCLPLIYQPFDAGDPAHFSDRGAAHDFSQAVGGGRVLDFGPGDGWPSLIIAPYCEQVIGVDASLKRVQTCTANAARLGIANTGFLRVPAGQPLPFADGEFDGVVASSSIEQTPDPRAALNELHRALRPGGRLRMYYEALGRYRGGQERELWLWRDQPGPRHLLLTVRHIDDEWARQYRLTLALSDEQVDRIFASHGRDFGYDALTEEVLVELSRHVTAAAVCDTYHPSGATWVRMLKDAGFRDVRPTLSGRRYARELFDSLAPEDRPPDMAGVDEYLRPLVARVIAQPAPLAGDPMLTAVK
jgi:SAM-dependent methyltransferase